MQMGDEDKTKKQLLNKITELKEKISRMEVAQAYFNVLEEDLKNKLALLDASFDAHVLTEMGEQGKIIYANEIAYKRLGYIKEEYLNLNVYDYIIPPEIENVRNQMKSISGDIQKVFATSLVHKDGHIIPVEVKIGLVKFRNRDCLLAISRDISKQKTMQDELKLRAEMLDNAHDSILISTVEGQILYANRTAVDLRGYSFDELISMTVYDLLPPENRDAGREDRKKFKEGGHYYSETTVLKKDGTYIPVEIDSSVINIAGKQLVLSITRDLTERRNYEQQLRLRAEMLDHASDLIMLTEIDGTIVYTNRTYSEISSPELIGQSLFNFLPSDYIDFIKEKRGITLQSGHVRYEASVADENGERVPGEIDSQLIELDGRKYILTMGRDLRERQKYESELALRAEMLDNASDSIIISTLEGQILYANRTALEKRGFSMDELLSISVFELLAPGAINKARELRQQYKDGGYYIFESDLLRKDGSSYPAEINNLIRDFGGRKLALSISRDLSERQKYEQQFQIIAKMLDYATDLIIVSEVDGVIVYANHNIFGKPIKSQGELVNKSIYDLVPPDEKEFLREKRDLTLQNGQTHYETMGINKNGISAPIEIQSQIIEMGGKKYILTVGRDMTERKKIEADLNLRAQLLDMAKDAIVIVDLEGNILYANKESVRISGFKGDNLEGTNFYTIVSKKTIQDMQNNVQKVLKGEMKTFEMDFMTADDIVIPIEGNIQVFEIDKQQLMLIVLRDISERKLAETRKKELEEKAQMTSRLAAVGEMAAGIAHEINNPLTAVVGYSELLLAGEIPESVRSDLEVIHEGGKRAATIVEGLLAFARQRKPQRKKVQINDLLKSTIDLQAYTLKTGNINVITHFDPRLPVTIADSNQIQQVFINLIINAQTAMKKHEGKGTLEISTERMDDLIRVSFRDTGPGIARDNLDRIFNPFFTTKEVGEGTGLGLSISHGIISEHNGRIYVSSDQEKGSTFVVELPIITKSEHPAFQDTEQQTPAKRKAKVLVVDDEAVIRKLVSRVLGNEGHEVDIVDNGEKALELIRNNRYNLILLDIKMPGIGGIELYNRIKDIAGSLTSRIVFITGDVMGEETQKFFNKTKVPYLMKPFDSNRLKFEINKLLDANEARG
jgi:PAS domain S-box-containing protein